MLKKFKILKRIKDIEMEFVFQRFQHFSYEEIMKERKKNFEKMEHILKDFGIFSKTFKFSKKK